MAVDSTATFISQKISRIRWKPCPNHIVEKPEVFVTGSWDNGEDSLCLWSLRSDDANQEDEILPIVQGEPHRLHSLSHAGHVTDIEYIDGDNFVVASSVGTVGLYKHSTRNQTLVRNKLWENLHHYVSTGCPCTGVAAKGDDTVVTVGEDGRINVLSTEQTAPVRVIERADSCTMNAVTFLKQFEIATVNSTGQLKVWDLRESGQQSARTFLMSGDCIGLQCVDNHPTQPHIVATGGQDGTLCIWDMRQDRFPVTLLDAHSAHMWEVKFHKSHPDNLFSCSEDGSVWHWDGSNINTPGVGQSKGIPGAHNLSMSMSMTLTNPAVGKGGTESFTSSWLASDATKHRLEITNLLPGNTMPVNTLDIYGNTLICGTDGEQIYTINNLSIK